MSRASAERIVEILDENSALTNPEKPVYEVKDGSITFKNVNFGYKKKLCLKNINLSISLDLYDFLMVSGINTVLTRDGDYEMYRAGEQRTKSDLYNRMDYINSVPNSILISIHQNHFENEEFVNWAKNHKNNRRTRKQYDWNSIYKMYVCMYKKILKDEND